jgi:cytidylate kinase
MTLVAISASFGAAGSVIAPRVAERLGVPFVDRAIPMAVAARLNVPLDDANVYDEGTGGGRLERMLRGFVGIDTGAPTPVPAEAFSSDDFRRATEEVLLRQAATGEGVILGRAAVIVLREHPETLRVRLHGPAERRARQAMELRGIEHAAAERGRRQLDRAHEDYARQFYGVSLDDPALYHLVLDSTAVPVATCVELIAIAARDLAPARAAKDR